MELRWETGVYSLPVLCTYQFGRGGGRASHYNTYWTSVGSTRVGLLKFLQGFLSSASKYCERVEFVDVTTFVILGDGDLTLNGVLRAGN